MREVFRKIRTIMGIKDNTLHKDLRDARKQMDEESKRQKKEKAEKVASVKEFNKKAGMLFKPIQTKILRDYFRGKAYSRIHEIHPNAPYDGYVMGLDNDNYVNHNPSLRVYIEIRASLNGDVRLTGSRGISRLREMHFHIDDSNLQEMLIEEILALLNGKSSNFSKRRE